MSKRKKLAKGEYTCKCGAYKFPHRFGGGKCTGRWIVRNTWEEYDGFGQSCMQCNSRNDTDGIPYCEVLEGLEDVYLCPEWDEFVNYHEIKIYAKK